MIKLKDILGIIYDRSLHVCIDSPNGLYDASCGNYSNIPEHVKECIVDEIDVYTDNELRIFVK